MGRTSGLDVARHVQAGGADLFLGSDQNLIPSLALKPLSLAPDPYWPV